MPAAIQTLTPADFFAPIGPYSHMTVAGPFITISGTPGVDPRTGQMAGPDVASQARQILENFRTLLASQAAGFEHVLHIQVFMKDVAGFAAMNQAYAEAIGPHRPARTVIGVADLPKAGALLTMNLQAITPAALAASGVAREG
jgi:2-iminobutanoate/2-iminopropanoate deaminase